MLVIELLAAITEYVSGLLVLAAFFTRRKNGKHTSTLVILLCGLAHIFLSTLTTAWPLCLRSVFILINLFVLSSAHYTGNWVKKLLVVLLYWSSVSAIDISVLTLAMAIINQSAQTVLSQQASYLFGVLSSRSLLLTISLSCGYLVRRQVRKRELVGSSRLWIVLLLIPLYTIIGTGALINSAMAGGTLSVDIIALSGGLLCINAILCFVINQLEQNRLMEKENQILQSEAAHQLKLAKMYQNYFAQQRRITHEFRNQLDAISNLLDQGEYDRAESYVRQVQCAAQEAVPLIHTNHPMVDAVLNQKYQEALQRGIGMLLRCNDLSALSLEDGDLVTLLGNVLDNAISASAQTEGKRIWMRMWYEQGSCQFIVCNDCLDESAGSAPQESMLHGYGMSLVDTVLEKNECPYYAEKVGSEFIFSAILT